MKSKKISWLAFSALMIFGSLLHGQTPLGIYLSAKDFKTEKLSFIKSKNTKCKIKLHDFIYKPYITVKCSDSSYTFKKDSIFG